MRAMILHRPAPAAEHPLALESTPDPEPKPGEVLVDVLACGVCRTDLHVVEGDLTPPSYPVIPGHEVVGRVAAVGADVTRFAVGDRVGVAWVGRFDGTCRFCRSGRENLCEHPTFTGFDRPGGYAERITAVADYVHPVPEALGDDAGVAPLLCAGIIGYRALRQSGYTPGAPVALYGFGGAAHIAIQIARGWGSEVFVVSPGEGSLERARALGAAWTGRPGSRLPQKVPHAVDFAPVGSIIPDALADLDKGGTLSIAGIHVDRIPELDYETHLFQERSVVSTTANTREDARELLELAARFGVRTDIRRFGLQDANEALERLAAGTLGAQAGVLEIAGK